MPPGESSCPDGSEYVWERGVGSLQGRVTAAWSWPLFREEKNHLRWCSKKLGGHNFDFRAKSSWEKFLYMLKIFSQGDFALESKLWPPSFLLHRLRWFYFSWNKGQLRAAVTRPCRLSTPFAIHILNRLDMRIHQAAPKIYHTYSKIWVNRDWVIRFLGFFWWFLRSGARFT